MSIPFAPGTTIACALLLALSCVACTRPPPPPPQQPPEPQAHAHAQRSDALRAPIEQATAVAGAVQDAADKQAAAIDAAAGG
jgi:hypothetical protein